MENKLEIVKKYFNLLEEFSTEIEAFQEVLHDKFRQKEYPNALNKKGQESDFNQIIQRLESGKSMLSQQIYKIENVHESGPDTLIVESIWTGTFRNDIGAFKAGQNLKAFFCIICDFENGKIVSQRNYDCFEDL